MRDLAGGMIQNRRQGFRKDRGLTLENRKCEIKLETSHRSILEVNMMLLNSMKAVGMGTPQIFGSIANQCGGYDRVGYRIKDMYNQTGRQQRLKNVDGKLALKCLSSLSVNDPLMFFHHTIDDENRLQHLFWRDGTMQMNYPMFSDVLAFDATYRNNKYECPLVVFYDVNHHNKTMVFGVAIVSNETKEIHVWLLEKLLEAMKGKPPMFVITNGDLAMRNSIRKVFPNAYNCLCA
ncbi:hypothetical protein JHK85_023012 [Glycine max]|nr:hypothetical protein JHK85_023012 [Glycine max]KAG5026622.1 hypothetical protein JHK86_022536 [Glycine max]